MFEHSPRLTLPYIRPAQAQKHVTHNQAIRQIDGLIHMSVASDALSTPPTEQVEGTCYLVPPTAQDGWQGWAHHVAIWQDAAWMFLTPKTGWRLFVSDQKKLMVYHGSAWVVLADANPHHSLEALSIQATTTATQRLAVQSHTILWTSISQSDDATGGIVHVLNKNAASQDNGLVFQNNYKPHLSMGCFGSNDFKISRIDEAGAHQDSLTLDSQSGILSSPTLPRFNAVLNYDYPLKENVWQRVPVNESKYNDQLCFDAEANQFRAPSAGTYFFSANVFLNNTDAVEQSCQIRFDCPLEGERASSLRVLSDLKSHSSATLSTQSLASLEEGDTVALQAQCAQTGATLLAGATGFLGFKIG